MYVICWTCVLLTHTAQCHVSTFQYFYLTAVVSQRQSWSSWLLPPVRTCFSISSRKSGLMRTCMGMRVPEIKAEVIPDQIRGRKNSGLCSGRFSGWQNKYRMDRMLGRWYSSGCYKNSHIIFYARNNELSQHTHTSVYTVHSLHGLRMFIV